MVCRHGGLFSQTLIWLSLAVMLFGTAGVFAQSTSGQDNAVVSGGAAPGQPMVKVHADSSGALIPEVKRAPLETGTETVDAPVSGGFAPKGGTAAGAAPATATAGAAALPKPPASGGVSSGALDYAAWGRMATRVESAITNTSMTNVALESLRLELTRWREQLLGAQTANSARIATLKTQIAALGALPADGTVEQPEIAKRREELATQMARLQAPGLAADEAYRRANGLIGEIDRVLRERQADELLKLWPSPLNPANWGDAATALSKTAMALWSETAVRAAEPFARKKLVDNLPLILPLLVLAAALLGRGRMWMDRLVLLLQGPSNARARRVWGFVASLGIILVPVAGFVSLAQALQRSGMFGTVGLTIVGAFGEIGMSLFAAVWLGNRVFPVVEGVVGLLDLPPDRRAEGRFLTTSFGALLALAVLRRSALAEIDVGDAGTAVLTFPVILIGGLLLARFGLLMGHATLPDAEDGKANYLARIMKPLSRGVILLGTVAPVLAAIGYISAASALIFPAAMTLGLAGLLYLMQRLVGDLYGLVMRTEGPAEQDALAPVLINFALALATLPIVALIWGARVSDLTEVWTRFQEGFQLGATRISPTDFLFFAVVFAIGLTLTRVMQGAMKTSILPRTGLDHGGQNAVVSGLGYAGILVSALVAINSTGIDLSGLAIVAGALSVGIGFGLQNIVSNFVSGIILLIERPVSEGDWIEVGTVQGIVKAISVRSTRIQTFDRSDVIVPNSDLISGRVTNWTRFSLTGRLIVVVGVPYTENSRRVSAILREIAEAQPLVLLSPPPMVVFTGFVAEVMQFEIRVILRDVNFQFEVRTEINHQIAARFAAEHIPFTAAHRDYLARAALDAAVEAEAVAVEAANIAAVEAILGAPLPATVRVLTAPQRLPNAPDGSAARADAAVEQAQASPSTATTAAATSAKSSPPKDHA